MANADYDVDVFWEAVPYGDDYYRLSDPDRLQVNQLLLDRVNNFIPVQQQMTWRDIPVLNADYDGIRQTINTRLSQEVAPPAGKTLVLSNEAAVYWLPTTTGHRILFFASLHDPGQGTTDVWEFAVQFNGKTYPARMGVAYACKLR